MQVGLEFHIFSSLFSLSFFFLADATVLSSRYQKEENWTQTPQNVKV